MLDEELLFEPQPFSVLAHFARQHSFLEFGVVVNVGLRIANPIAVQLPAGGKNQPPVFRATNRALKRVLPPRSCAKRCGFPALLKQEVYEGSMRPDGILIPGLGIRVIHLL